MFSLISAGSSIAAEISSTFAFKYHMHRLYDSYTHTRISTSLRQYDIANIYLSHMNESVGEIRNFIPEKNAEGYKLDRAQFIQRLDNLNKSILELKAASDKGDPKETKLLTQEVFNVCVGCHKEVKLKYLFKLSVSRTPFAEYMHSLSEHLDLARIYIESGSSAEKVEENLKLIRYYLGLLEDTFPEKGPSGVILDRRDFDKRLKEVKENSEEMLKLGKGIKATNVEQFKQSLNGFCVICHEPERLK